MAPIPNPAEYASATPPYRLIGPTVPDAPALAEQSRPVRVAAKGRPVAHRIVQAEAPTRGRTKPRVRHWIIPAGGPS